jgi:hypothetical protein
VMSPYGAERTCQNTSTMPLLGTFRTEYARCEPIRF